MFFKNQTVNKDGHLEICGCDTSALAKEYGTPLYVMDEEMLRDNCRRYVKGFGNDYPEADVAYASKAFIVAAMCRLVGEEGMWLDVASEGELYTALVAGFDPGKIVYHGNFKKASELKEAVDKGVKVVCDSFKEIEMLSLLAQKAGENARVMVRCNPGIDPHTHKMISTGQEDSKFGFNIKSGDAIKAIGQVLSADGLDFVGVHCHLGSQLMDDGPFAEAAPVMAGFFEVLRSELSVEPEILDLGGGLGVRYTEEDKPMGIEEFCGMVTGGIKKAFREKGLALPHLLIEPGRSVVAEAGTTLYTVGQPKAIALSEEPYAKTYLPVDGGLSDNPRPSLYGARYTAVVANRADRPADTLYTVSGRHCETDLLFPDMMLQKAEWGDILAVHTTGAYGHSMASNYNRFTKPAVVFVRDGKARLVYRRETLEDLVRCDII